MARPVPDPGCSMCGSTSDDLAARQRLATAFEALAAAQRDHATVVRIDDMRAVLSGLLLKVGGRRR